MESQLELPNRFLALGDFTGPPGWLRSRQSTGHCLPFLLWPAHAAVSALVMGSACVTSENSHGSEAPTNLFCSAKLCKLRGMVQTGGMATSTMSGKLFSLTSSRYSCSRLRGRAWSRFVSTAHAVLHKSATIPVSKHNYNGKSELKLSWLSANLGLSTVYNVGEVCVQI